MTDNAINTWLHIVSLFIGLHVYSGCGYTVITVVVSDLRTQLWWWVCSVKQSLVCSCSASSLV